MRNGASFRVWPFFFFKNVNLIQSISFTPFIRYVFAIAGQNFPTPIFISYWIAYVSTIFWLNLFVKCEVELELFGWLFFHRNYWRDPDTALFILRHLYRDIPEEPVSPNEQHIKDGSEDENSSTRWSDPRDVADEELPLTFAGTVSRKNFSQRARKIKSWRYSATFYMVGYTVRQLRDKSDF